MPLPFLTGRRTPSKRSGAGDPFLEFRSEIDTDPFAQTSAPLTRPAFPEPSAINPAVAFALGVAGLVTAVVAYYQLIEVLSTKPPVQIVTVTATPSPSLITVPALPEVAVTPTPLLGPPAPPEPTAPPPPGWVTLEASIELQVFEGRRLIGTSKGTRLELPPGSHTLTLVNDTYEVRQTIPIAVTTNATTQRRITLPTGSISLSALPWAQAWIDGVPVGTTPLANLQLPIGVHEVVWAHPSLGERRQRVIAKAKTPLRVGVDFTR